MAYLLISEDSASVPVKPDIRPFDWADMLATWGTFAAVLAILYYEYQTFRRT